MQVILCRDEFLAVHVLINACSACFVLKCNLIKITMSPYCERH